MISVPPNRGQFSFDPLHLDLVGDKSAKKLSAIPRARPLGVGKLGNLRMQKKDSLPPSTWAHLAPDRNLALRFGRGAFHVTLVVLSE
jgi:hypothetical protein